MKEKLAHICRVFRIAGEMVSYEEIKAGNVNRTYKVKCLRPDGTYKNYIVQAVNTYAFKNPIEVMSNIDGVTEHIRARKEGCVALHFHHTEEGKTYYFGEGGFWRLFNYISSDTYNSTEDLQVIRNAGEAFGEFQMLLSDFDASRLYETIPDFHNTKKRYEKLWEDAANSHFLRTAGPHSPDSPGHIKRTVLEISRAERGLRPANQYQALSQKAMPSQSVR